MEKKNKSGRPLSFKSPEELQKKIDLYFWAVRENNKDVKLLDYTPEQKEILDVITDVIPTVTGLAIALGVDRRTITNYEDRDEYFPTIKKAKVRIENAVEQRLYLSHPAGSIFNLKNNFGWEDRSTQDGNLTLTINKNIRNADN